MIAKIGVFHMRCIYFFELRKVKNIKCGSFCPHVIVYKSLYHNWVANCTTKNKHPPPPPAHCNSLHLLLLAPLVQLRDMYLDHTSQPHPSLFLLLILIQPASPLPLLLVVHSPLGCFLLGVQLHLAVHGH